MLDINTNKRILNNIIHEIWSQVLTQGKFKIDSDDNFFLMGGDSLSMSQILVRLNQRFNTNLSLHDLFHLSSINKMTEYFYEIDHHFYSHASSIYEQDKLTSDKYLASSGQAGLWFVEQCQLNNLLLYNTAVKVILKGKIDVKCFKKAYQHLFERHNMLRSSFHFNIKKNSLTVKINADIKSSLVVIDTDKAGLNEYINNCLQSNFTFSETGLLKAHLFIIDKNISVFVLVLHHIITDGWSNRILINELAKLYNLVINHQEINSASSLKPLCSYYQDYCLWQIQYMQGSDYRLGLEYWRRKLSGTSKLNNLSNSPSSTLYASQNYCLNIDVTTSKLITQFSHAFAFTPYMIFLTAFKIILAKHTNKYDLTIASPVSNRKYPAWEHVVGYYVNLLVFREKIDIHESAIVLLHRVKQTVLLGFHYQDVPFPELVKSLGASGEQYPLFDILFSYQNLPQPKVDFDQLDCLLEKIKNPLCHYTVNLDISETETGFIGNIEFAHSFFNTEERLAIIHDFPRILKRITDQPEISLNELI